MSPIWPADGEEPLCGHRQSGVDRAVLADVGQGVEVGQEQREGVHSITTIQDLTEGRRIEDIEQKPWTSIQTSVHFNNIFYFLMYDVCLIQSPAFVINFIVKDFIKI